MRVLMRTTAAGPGRNLQAGLEYDLPTAEAADLVSAGAAVPLDPPVEVAAVAPAETATAPAQKPRAGVRRIFARGD